MSQIHRSRVVGEARRLVCSCSRNVDRLDERTGDRSLDDYRSALSVAQDEEGAGHRVVFDRLGILDAERRHVEVADKAARRRVLVDLGVGPVGDEDAVMRRVVGNPLRIGVAEGLHTEGVPAVIGSTDDVIRAWIEAEDRLLTVVREVVDVLSGDVSDPGRLVTHGNDSWLNLGDVRRADDVAAETSSPRRSHLRNG